MEREVLRERHDLRKTILAKLDEKYRRVSFAHLPTPLIFCPRLSEETGVEVWMKRDDLTGIALGGNKSRHLEYVLAEALAAKANVVVFGAAVQSNYARQLTAACAQLGLKVYLILTTYYGQSRGQGNVLLDKLFGAAIEYVNVPLNSMGPFKFAARAQLLEKGHRPYVIEPPSSEVLGAASYLRAAVELDEQLESIGLEPKSIFLAAAGPTQAGLVAGKKALNWDLSVVGVAPTTTEFAVAQDVFEVSNSVLDELNLTVTVTRSDVTNLPQYAGPSYGKPTPESLQAINKLAQLEGILLDPIYTGKAMAGLLDQVRSGDRQGPIIFWHTGGIPAIFAFPEHWITEP